MTLHHLQSLLKPYDTFVKETEISPYSQSLVFFITGIIFQSSLTHLFIFPQMMEWATFANQTLTKTRWSTGLITVQKMQRSHWQTSEPIRRLYWTQRAMLRLTPTGWFLTRWQISKRLIYIYIYTSFDTSLQKTMFEMCNADKIFALLQREWRLSRLWIVTLALLLVRRCLFVHHG